MKLSQALLTVLASSTLGHTALAQNAGVSAEKQGYQALSPDLYGSVEVRHAVLRTQNGDKVAQELPALSVRPTLGLKLFEGAVDSAFTFIYRKNPGSMVVNKAALFNETSWTALQGKYGAISPYAYSEFNPDGNAFVFSNVGVNFATSNLYENDLGTLKLSAYLEPKVQVLSNRTSKNETFRVVPRNETARGTLAFDDQGTTSIEQRDPTLVDDLGVAFSVSPVQAKKLSSGFSVDVQSQWKPKYVTTETAGSLNSSLDGYERRSFTLTSWNLAFKISDKVTLSNRVGHYMGGLYNYPIQNELVAANHELVAGRWEERLSLTAKLF